MPDIDPSSPVPLYLQIAESIRGRIERGELGQGDALTPLREAAEQWGVNLHTVRHAYTALAREGLVASHGSRGTRVLSKTNAAPPEAKPPNSSLYAIVDRAIDDARAQGIALQDLATAIVARSHVQRPVVYIVECSVHQCESHARELEAAWDVVAHPWPLDAHEGPPPGLVIATYFHYNDIRRRWPTRLRQVHFVAIGPDPAIRDRLPPDTHRIRVCETDLATAEAIAADVSVLLGDDIAVEPQVTADPKTTLGHDDQASVLFPPRAWSRLDNVARADRRAIALAYVIDPADLASLGEGLGWGPATRRS